MGTTGDHSSMACPPRILSSLRESGGSNAAVSLVEQYKMPLQIPGAGE